MTPARLEEIRHEYDPTGYLEELADEVEELAGEVERLRRSASIVVEENQRLAACGSSLELEERERALRDALANLEKALLK